ncbi:MAG TPA: hypothetical protein VGE07_27780 [Herpetosiphonaceae bacterium]
MIAWVPRRRWLAGLCVVLALTALAWPRPAQACTRRLSPEEWLSWYEPAVVVDQSALPAGLKITPLPIENWPGIGSNPPKISLRNEGHRPAEIVVADVYGSSGVTATFRLRDEQVYVPRDGKWVLATNDQELIIALVPPAASLAPAVDTRYGEGRPATLPATQTLTLSLLHDNEPLAVPLQLGHPLNPTYDPAGYKQLSSCGSGFGRAVLYLWGIGGCLALCACIAAALVAIFLWRRASRWLGETY